MWIVFVDKYQSEYINDIFLTQEHCDDVLYIMVVIHVILNSTLGVGWQNLTLFEWFSNLLIPRHGKSTFSSNK